MEKFKDFLADFIVLVVVIMLCILCGFLLLIGTLAIFGSMFFEVPFSQITLLLVLKHVAIFIGGVISIALGISLGEIILSKIFD